MAKLSLSFKGHPITVHHFDEGTEVITIGRNPGCTLLIDSLAIAPMHAKVISSQGESQIVAMTDELPTLVNSRPITEHLLSHGDIIQVGKHTLTFAEDGQTFGALTAPTPRSVKPRTFQPCSTAPNTNKQTIHHMPRHKKPNLSGISDKDLATVEQQSQLKTCIQIVNGNQFGRVVSVENGLTRLGIDGLATAVIAHRRDGYFLSHLEGNKPPCINGQSIKEQSQQLFDGDNIQIANGRMIFPHQHTAISSQIAVDG